MTQDLSFWGLVFQASFFVKLIMLILLASMLLSVMITGKKLMRFARLRYKNQRLLQEFWSDDGATKLFQRLQGRKTEGLESLFVAGFSEFQQFSTKDLKNDEIIIANCRRAMQIAISRELDKQEALLPLLATTGSTSPYIGLLGTVYGIMTSFISLGSVKSASINHVAPGIAEALIATAIGLLAAITAVLAYNYFISASDRLNVEYETFSEEFINLLQRQLLVAKAQVSYAR